MNNRTTLRAAALVLASIFVFANVLGGTARAQLATITKEVVLAHSSDDNLTAPVPTWIGKTDTFVDEAHEGKRTFIERVSAMNGQHTRVVAGEAPAPSPDGRLIAYIVRSGKRGQIWMCSSDGSHARKVAQLGPGSGDTFGVQLAWSYNSQKLAYSVVYDPGSNLVTGKSTVEVYGGDSTKNTGTATIGIISLDGTATHTFTLPQKLDSIYQLAWLHANNSLVMITAIRAPGEGVETGMYRVNATTGAMHQLVGLATGQHVSALSVSPIDDTLEFTGGRGGSRYPMHHDLGLVSSSGQVRYVPGATEIGCFAWRPNGPGFYFCKIDGSMLQTHIYSGDASGAHHLLLKQDGTVLSAPSVSPNGKFITWVAGDLNEAQFLHMYSFATGRTQITRLSDPTAGYQIGQTSRITWKSRDGFPIEGILIKPVGYQRGHKYPMIVDIHGGPLSGLFGKEGPFVFGSALEHSFWATKGFVVFYPDYRESRIGGWEQFELRRKHNDYFDRDFDDIMSGVDTVIAMGMVDTKRMVIDGHSWGSYVTNWMITHTNRFAAAISYEGGADLAMDWGNKYRQYKPNEWRFDDTSPVTDPARWRKEAATTYVSNVKTPTLFINAQNGIDNPTMPWMYAALRRQGIESTYLCYQGEGHVVSKMANKSDIFDRTYSWVMDHTR